MPGTVKAIFIAPIAGAPMQAVSQIQAIAGQGLEGDRYAQGAGSFNKGSPGKRQVTLINGIFFAGTEFEFGDCRRNIITLGVELMWLIGREFKIGQAVFRGLKYCDPCYRPSHLAGKTQSFQEAFFDRGGLVAEIIQSGLIRKGIRLFRRQRVIKQVSPLTKSKMSATIITPETGRCSSVGRAAHS